MSFLDGIGSDVKAFAQDAEHIAESGTQALSNIPDPIAMGIGALGNALGLDPKVVGLAKCAVGLMTGDVACTIDGASDVMNSRANPSDQAPQADGYAPPSSDGTPAASSSAPAAAAAPGSSATMDDRTALQTLRENFAAIDTDRDGKLSPLELSMATRSQSLPQSVRDACQHLIDNQDLLTALHKESGTQDGPLAGERTITTAGLDEELTRYPATPATSAPAPASTPASSASPAPASSSSVPGSPSAPSGETRALSYLQQHFGEFDTAAGIGKPDGLVGRNDLEAVLKNPSSSPEAREAAKYLLDHPEVFDRVETAQYGGQKDGLIGIGDLGAALAQKAPAAAPPSAPVATPATAPAAPATRASGSVSSNPATSNEDKLHAAMDSAQSRYDDLINQLNNGSDLNQAQIAKIQEQLQAVQRLMELISNFEKANHDMQMQIIGNIR